MYGSTVNQRNEFDPGCCFLIKHSETLRGFKEGSLLLIETVALTAIAAGVLAVLALNGVNLGGINSIAAMIGEQWIYIGLVSGLALFALNSALIAALTRSYYDKQFTQNEIDNLNLGGWVTGADLFSKLEPGQYWRFPVAYDNAIREGENQRPAVFGALVRNHDGNFGVYACKTEEDLFALIHANDYVNGEVEFTNSLTFTSSYIQTKLDHQFAYYLENDGFAFTKECETWEFVIQEVGLENETDIFALRQGKQAPQFFKTEEARTQAMQGLFRSTDIEQALRELDDIPYLPEGTYWERTNPIEVTAVGSNDPTYLYVLEKNGANGRTATYYESMQERSIIAHATRMRDAKAAWEDQIEWPQDWVQECATVNQLNQDPIDIGELVVSGEFSQNNNAIFALCYRCSEDQSVTRFFKSAEARANFIRTTLPNYHNKTEIRTAAGNVIDRNFLKNIFTTPNVDCWVADPIEIEGKQYFILVVKSGQLENQIAYRYFLSEEERQNLINDSENLAPLNTIYGPGGEYKAEWIENNDNVNQENRTRATDAIVGNNQFRWGEFQTLGNKPVFWVTAQNNEGIKTTRYFGAREAFASHLQRQLAGALNLTLRERLALEFKESHLLDTALSQNGDFWGTQVDVNGTMANVLFTKTEEGIQITYPENLPNEENEHNIRYMIQFKGEYPKALGEFLMKKTEFQQNWPSMIFNGEYATWQEKQTTIDKFPKCFFVQIKEGNTVTERFFANFEARRLACENFSNGYTRYLNDHQIAIRKSIAVNEKLKENAVNHFICIEHELKGKHYVFIPKAIPNEENWKPESKCCSLNELITTEGYVDVNEAYDDYIDFSQNEMNHIDHYEAAGYLNEAFGKNIQMPNGKLKKAQYMIFEKNGIYGLLWLANDEVPRAQRQYFKSDESRQQYINQELQGINLVAN